jgi:hypothetical protein
MEPTVTGDHHASEGNVVESERMRRKTPFA